MKVQILWEYICKVHSVVLILILVKFIWGFLLFSLFSKLQEIKFEPTVMCEHVDKKLSFRASQVYLMSINYQHEGDIIMLEYCCLIWIFFCSLKMEILFVIKNHLHQIMNISIPILMCHHFWSISIIDRCISVFYHFMQCYYFSCMRLISLVVIFNILRIFFTPLS